MKFLIAFALLMTYVAAQRPTYAGLSSKGYPELASRFRDPADDEENVANSVVNRFGEANDPATQNLPTDARGDVVLVNRLNQWPREHRPFWLLNAEHVEKQRRPNENPNQQQGTQNNMQQTIQQRFSDEPLPNLRRNQLLSEERQQTFSNNARSDLGPQVGVGQSGQIEPRLGEPRGTETRTIRPVDQRGSFAG